MQMKRYFSAALSAALLCGMLTVAPAAQAAGFADIADPDIQEAASLLQIMEVVDGDGNGYFFPELDLTRAQFCKMAVNIRGDGSKAEAQQNRTIFSDVPATHWGRGYINYASSVTVTEGGERLVMGVGDGTFHPDDNIAFAEAVTMVMRLLGYTASDVSAGATWYDGYLSTARTIGLLDNLDAAPNDPLTRAQAAVLFRNLLFTETRDSSKSYLSALGGSEVEGGIVLDVTAKADDGAPALETTKGVYKTDRSFDAALEGREGKAVLDKDGKLIAFVPKTGTSQRVVNITATEATYLMAAGGEKITVEPETVVYRDNKATTWKDAYLSVATPTPVTFHYGANGKLSYLFFSAADPDGANVMVARRLAAGANPFAAMAGGKAYTMFKNGVAATAADIRQYDVATYDAGTGVMQISDLRLTGIYEDASPSPAAPVSIKVMGHTFPVLSTAREDLNSFHVGDQITLLLTTDAQVAGVVSASTVRSQAVGLATASEGKATVKLLQSGLEISGKVSDGAAERCNNQLVIATGSAIDRLSLTPVSTSAVSGDLDVFANRLGDRELAENVVVYDRVEGGDVVSVDYNALSIASVPKSKISFVDYDYAGRVRCMVLNNVTGDAYDYGYFVMKKVADSPEMQAHETLAVKQSGGSSKTGILPSGKLVRQNAIGGMALTADGNVAATVELKALTGVSRSAFDPEEMTVTVAGVSYPVSEKVECYNETTETWFKTGKEGMEAARAYSDDLTLYYDRAPSEGGKIRLIVVP